jgi:hypothetical protein
MRKLNKIDWHEAENGFLASESSVREVGDRGPASAGASRRGVPPANCALTSRDDAAGRLGVPFTARVPSWPLVFPGL